MQGYKVSLLGTPTSNTDATNKLYVDNAISGLNIGNYATLTQLNPVNNNANSKLSLSGGLINGNITTQTGALISNIFT